MWAQRNLSGSQPADSLDDSPLGIGFVRMHNKLLEALIAAPFSGVQRRIFDCLYRLTVGWHREVVCISQSELAKCIGLPLSGSFRRALSSLVGAGVVRRLETGSGRRVSSLSLELDFRKWGRFAVQQADLTARFARRPVHNDSPSEPTRAAPRPRVQPGGQDGYTTAGSPPRPSTQRRSLNETLDAVNSETRAGSTNVGSSTERKSAVIAGDTLEHERRIQRVSQYIPTEFEVDLARVEASAPDVYALYAYLDGLVSGNASGLSGRGLGQALRDFLANGKAKKFRLLTLRRYVDALCYEPDGGTTARTGSDRRVKRSRYSPDEYRQERERQESIQNRRKLIAGNVSVRLQKPDGEDWLRQMQAEARAANIELHDYIDAWQKGALVPPPAG